MGDDASLQAKEGQSDREAGKRSSPWNSLEVARLIMSSATPIVIAAMGYTLTEQSERQAHKREMLDRRIADAADKRAREETLARDDAIRAAAAAAEERNRRDSQARDDAIRRANEARDDAIRRAGEAREAALRADAIARDEAASRQSERLARLTSLIQKRTELWDKIGPIVTSLSVVVRSTPPDREAGLAQLEELRRAWTPHIFYFPKDFNTAMEIYAQAVLAILEGRERYDFNRMLNLHGEVREQMEAATQVPETLDRSIARVEP